MHAEIPSFAKIDVDNAAVGLLNAQQAVIGKRVLSAGNEPDAGDVISADLLVQNHVLMPHHPGRITGFAGPGLNHCLVGFFGLEQEPISFAVGFDHDEDGFYRALIDPTEIEWHSAMSTGWWDNEQAAGLKLNRSWSDGSADETAHAIRDGHGEHAAEHIAYDGRARRRLTQPRAHGAGDHQGDRYRHEADRHAKVRAG